MLHSMKALLLAGLLTLSSSCASPESVQTPAPSSDETAIVLADSGVTVDGQAVSADPTAPVYVGGEIIYYYDGTDETYGEGESGEAHRAEEAAAHTLVTITQPGTYRLSGTLPQGQIAIDLGEGAKDDPAAVVTLILDNANVTCTVAPALIFYNVYECDRAFVAYSRGEDPDYKASATVDTTQAGANVILAAGSVNTFTGSHVARIYKPGTTDNLHRYDGAFYSRMSMNISGQNGDDSGVLNILADNEGLDTELHLTVNGGTVNVHAQDDGVNTNEDFVSVTTVNGGSLTVDAGNGAEGDGIDSNGYLVINGGSVTAMSNDRAPDGGVDADCDILIHGGTLAAFGVRNDSVSQNSRQTYLEFTLTSPLAQGSLLELKDAEGAVIWSATAQRAHQTVTVSTPQLAADGTYQLYVDGVLQEQSGSGFGHRGMGFPGGGRPGEGQTPPALPEDFDPSRFDGQRPQRPDGFDPDQADGSRPQRPEGFEPPEGFDPSQLDPQRPQRGQNGGPGGRDRGQNGGDAPAEPQPSDAV